METVKNVAERITGRASNGFRQTDVVDLRGKVSEYTRGYIDSVLTAGPEFDCVYQTALVTGGTQGIGFEVAKVLALANARVFLLSRKEENAQDAVAKIKQASSGAIPDVTFLQCDLGNLRQVRDVADNVRDNESRLDIVRCAATLFGRYYRD